MTGHRLPDMVRLEGHRVGIALTDGSRIDDCQLVFAGRDSLWVFINGDDAFVSASTVRDFWESN